MIDDLACNDQYVLVYAWQENWGSVWNKFMEGRIVYTKRSDGHEEQGDAGAGTTTSRRLYTREFYIKAHTIQLREDHESPPFHDALSPMYVKPMAVGKAWTTL